MAASLRRYFQTVQGQLFSLACIFILLIATSLTLSPAVQARSWDTDYRVVHWIGAFGWLLSFGGIQFFLSGKRLKPPQSSHQLFLF